MEAAAQKRRPPLAGAESGVEEAPGILGVAGDQLPDGLAVVEEEESPVVLGDHQGVEAVAVLRRGQVHGLGIGSPRLGQRAVHADALRRGQRRVGPEQHESLVEEDRARLRAGPRVAVRSPLADGSAAHERWSRRHYRRTRCPVCRRR